MRHTKHGTPMKAAPSLMLVEPSFPPSEQNPQATEGWNINAFIIAKCRGIQGMQFSAWWIGGWENQKCHQKLTCPWKYSPCWQVTNRTETGSTGPKLSEVHALLSKWERNEDAIRAKTTHYFPPHKGMGQKSASLSMLGGNFHTVWNCQVIEIKLAMT